MLKFFGRTTIILGSHLDTGWTDTTQNSIRAIEMVPKTLLHIDDDPMFTCLIEKALKTHGWEVEPLNDPVQWCEQLGQHRIVLLDMNMPGYSGIDVLRDIKNYDRTIHVIMMTGVSTLTTVIGCLSAGAEYCFFKPITSFEPLVDALDRTHFRVEHWRNAAAWVAEERAAVRTAFASTD
jgi:DNA-binding NtrC family response regulator